MASRERLEGKVEEEAVHALKKEKIKLLEPLRLDFQFEVAQQQGASLGRVTADRLKSGGGPNQSLCIVVRVDAGSCYSTPGGQ